jgi:predicted nucleic acid-binding protein
MKSDFIDTNIWVYAFLESEKDPRKKRIALALYGLFAIPESVPTKR